MAGAPLPLWSREETILALWLAAARAGDELRVCDPDVAILSDFLRSAGRSENRRFRNSNGVARKVWRFLNLLEGAPLTGLSAIEAAVWKELSGAPDCLAKAAAMAAAKIAAAGAVDCDPSRGPPPSTGDIITRRTDIGAWLYLAVLSGFILEDGDILVKVGRSNDTTRREAELNFGLPPILGLRWRMAKSWYLPDQAQAHRAEQAILAEACDAGITMGGEFIRLHAVDFGTLASRCERVMGLQRSQDDRGCRDRRQPSRSKRVRIRVHSGSKRQSRATASTASSNVGISGSPAKAIPPTNRSYSIE